MFFGSYAEVDIIHIVSSGVTYKWRPKELRGLDDNNGWVRVEDRFPEASGIYKVIRIHSEEQETAEYFAGKGFTNYCGYRVTHWRPLEVYPNPHY